MFLSKFIVVVASVTSLAGARSINLSAITTRANSGNGTNVTTEPSPWTPVPVNPTFINGTITTPEAAPNGGNHPAPPAPPGVKGNAFCYPTGRGTCSVGLYLTYDQSAMNIYIFNNGCKMIGAATGLAFDHPVSISSQLPFMVVMEPHVEVPSGFWYAGSHYQNGWGFMMAASDNSGWYIRMVFQC